MQVLFQKDNAKGCKDEEIWEETLITEDFCSWPRKASFGRSEVYQDIHELRTKLACGSR
jgi:hypothetical protein